MSHKGRHQKGWAMTIISFSQCKRMISRQRCLPPSHPRWPFPGIYQRQNFWIFETFIDQVLRICLDGLEEGDIGWGSLVAHSSQPVKVFIWFVPYIEFLNQVSRGRSSVGQEVDEVCQEEEGREETGFHPSNLGQVCAIRCFCFGFKLPTSRCFWFDFFWSAILTAVSSVLQFASPLLVNQLIGW